MEDPTPTVQPRTKFGMSLDIYKNTSRYSMGGRKAKALLKELQFDPIVELVSLYHHTAQELQRQYDIRDGIIIELRQDGKTKAYNYELTLRLMDKLESIADKLLRYGYGRVPETVLTANVKPPPMVVNLSNDDGTYVIGNDYSDAAEDLADDDD